MNIITDKQAKINIATLKKDGAKLDALIQATALYAIDQINRHGQTTPVNQLLGALNKSARKEALVIYIRDHAKATLNKNKVFEYRKDKKLFDTTVKVGKVEVTIEQALENADSKPFYDYSKEVIPSTSMDALASMESLLKRIQSFTGEVKHKELATELAKVIESAKQPA